MIGLNDERCFCGLSRPDRRREGRLTRELLQKSLASALQSWLAVAGERHRKRRVHCQVAGAGLHVGGKWHQIQYRLLSCGHRRVRQNTKNKYAQAMQSHILSHCPEILHRSVPNLLRLLCSTSFSILSYLGRTAKRIPFGAE